jgi:hypothetical protein
MLNFAQSKIMDSTERPVATGSTVTAEGAALVNDAANGGVKLATGAATDQFVGVSLSQQLTLLSLPAVEEITVPSTSTYTVTLAHTPTGGTLLVELAVAGTDLAAGNPATTAMEYSVSGAVLTFNVAQAGAAIRVAYRYAPTTVQARTIQGDVPPGGAASLSIGTVGVITKGDIMTTEFDTTVNWGTVSGTTPIKLSSGGLFTIGGSGVSVPAHVTSLPSVDSPFLGLYFSI